MHKLNEHKCIYAAQMKKENGRTCYEMYRSQMNERERERERESSEVIKTREQHT